MAYNTEAPTVMMQQYPPAKGEVLVIMRYKNEMDRSIRNCLIRMKSRTSQFGTEGKCLGITAQVHVLEATRYSDWCWRDDWCLAMFIFPSLEKARLWYISEPELRQHDFLPPSDGVQLFAMKLRYLPQPNMLTFNWMEMHNCRDNSVLQLEYVDKSAAAMDDQHINHGVVFVQDPGCPAQMFRLKESWIPHNERAYCVMHCYESPQQFQKHNADEKVQALKARRTQVCETVSLLFTLCPNITDAPMKYE